METKKGVEVSTKLVAVRQKPKAEIIIIREKLGAVELS